MTRLVNFRSLFMLISLSWISGNFSLYLSSHCSESVFNIKWFLSWGFQESNIKMISKLFCFLIWDLSLIFKIFFVTYENSRDIFLCMLIYFTHPFWNLGEWITISDIIGYYNTVSTFIITTCNCFKSLLTGSIPNLQFNCLSINIDCSDFEVHTNSGHEIIIENVILYKEIRFDKLS